MNKFHDTIISLGVTSELGNAQNNKRVKLLNIYTLIWMYLTTIFFVTDAVQGILLERILFGHFVTIMTLTSLCTVIYLNYLQKHFIAKWVFMITAIFVFNCSSLVVSPGIYTEYYFFLIPGLCLSLFDQKWISITFLIIAIVCFFLPYHILNIYPTDYTSRLDYPSMTSLFVAIYLLFNYFKKLNLKNEQLLMIERDRVISDKIILEEQEKELRELNEFKSHFFVNLSHEIRTPLTLIQGYASELKVSKLSVSDNKKLQVIEDQVSNMQSIVNDIMDLSKMDRKEFQLKLIEVNLNDFLLRPFISFKPLFEKKGIDFSFESLIQHTNALMDASLVEKAITNLLSNALKFTPEGGTVRLLLKPVNEGVTITISDTGIGIPEEAKAKLFDRFYQVKNDITKSQGSGIGLAFAKSIMDEHQFLISVEGELNKGTSLSIHIPKAAIRYQTSLEKKNLQHTSILSKEQIQFSKKQQHTKQVSRRKVLVVDDHEQMRNYIKTVLKDYEVIEAENGKIALEKLRQIKVDLIVTDYMMPVMDGEEFVKRLKTDNIKIPIVVLTARTDNEGKLKMLRLGIDSYLFKPFLKEELIQQARKGMQLFDALNAYQETLPEDELTIIDRQALKFQEKLQQFINAQMGKSNLNVEEIAQALNMSRSTLNRKTKALLGQNVKDLILEARLQKVKKLLNEDPDLTKSQVAQEVGMCNSTHLFEKYNARFGVNY